VPVTEWFAPWAWFGTGDAVERDVVIAVDGDRIASISTDVESAPSDARRLNGLVMPGLANAHSHCFHRALRGRTNAGGGTFWTWRDAMYKVAARLDPDSYYALARATYAEMALAGITAVGEFHYLHHARGGAPYSNPNAMSDALAAAASGAGIRLTLLDTCYLAGGFGTPLDEVQRRFSDGDAHAWVERVSTMTAGTNIRVGSAIHSVRAVPADQMRVVAAYAERQGGPLHVHVSEQRAENVACIETHGCTPAQLLADAGALGVPRTTAVHATHCTSGDIALMQESRTTICMCPTTERDLGDGIGPARAAADAGIAITLGSDGNSVIDLFEEARAMELDERLRTEQRGHWTPGALLAAATSSGHASIGWEDAGMLGAGMLADFICVSVDTPRLAGADPAHLLEALVFAAIAADVSDVVVGGRAIVSGGAHHSTPDLSGALGRAIAAATHD
jgi:formiminoglutamate deiminase